MSVRVLDRETGQVVFVDEAEAGPGIASGRYAVSADSPPIGLVNEAGEAFEVDAADLGGALQGGLSLETPDQATERDREARYGDQSTRAFLEGAARELTFGSSDPILAMATAGNGPGGIDRATEGLRERRARSPNAAMAGEVLGGVAPMLIPGAGLGRGATGVARGALRLGGAIPRSVGLAGEALTAFGTSALRGSAPGMARRVLSQAGGMALGGALEGSVQGAREILTEHSLGEADITAERVLAGAGIGAAFGTVAGGLFGSGSSLIGEGFRGAARGGRRLLGASADTIAMAYERSTGRQLGGGIGELYARASSIASGADEATIARFTGLSAEGRRARDLVTRSEDVYREGTERLVSQITEVERASRHAQDFALGSLKRRPIARAIRTDTIGMQVDAARVALDEARRISSDIMSNPHVFSGRGGVAAGRNLGRTVDGFASDLATAMQRAGTEPAEAAADIFITLDRFKRTVGRLQGRTSDPEATRILRRLYDGAQAGDEGYTGLRRLLEDDDIWGGTVTAMQRDSNAAWTNFLTNRRRYERSFLIEMDRDVAGIAAEGARTDAFRTLRRGDSAKLDGFVRQVGTGRNATSEEIFRNTIEAQQQLNDAIVQHFDVPPDVARRATESRTALDAIRSTLDEVSETAGTVNQFRDLTGDGGVARQAIGALGGAVIGLAAGDTEGAAIGGAIGTALASPGHAVRVLSALDRVAGSTSGRIAQSVSRFLGRGAKAASTARRVVGGVAARAGAVGRRTAVVTTVAAYREKIREIADLTGDPGTLTSRLAEHTSELERDAPGVQQAMQTTAVRGLTYLQDRLPPQSSSEHARLLPSTHQRQPSRSQIRDFMRIARAVETPLSLLDDIESRRINRASVDAVKAVYPQLYQQIVAEVMTQLQEAEREPSYRDRLQLGTLLGAPTDPSLRPEFIASMQASFSAARGGGDPAQQQPNPAAPTREAPQIAGQLASETRRLEA